MKMGKTTKILNLATALGALIAPSVAPETPNAARADESQMDTASETKPEIKLPRGEDLLRFTVHQGRDGMTAPQHESHVSHASHESHASHASGSY